ncbi:hypothetical protein KAJ27_04695, partial [bacterium]|nr:hypothetical protein [bacterium]
EHKGKVESNVNYVQENALRGKQFESLDAQNSHLRSWNRGWASVRIHGTTKRQVKAMYELERPHLLPLPATDYPFFKIGIRKVNAMDSHIEVGGAYYPVPPQFMGQSVQVHFNSQTVKVFSKGKCIQVLSTIKKGYFHPDQGCLPHQILNSRNTAQKAMLERCRVTGDKVLAWAEETLAHRDIIGYRAIQGVLSLTRSYSSDKLNKACELASERKAYNYSLVKHCLIEQSLHEQNAEEEAEHLTQQSNLIREMDDYAEHLQQQECMQ